MKRSSFFAVPFPERESVTLSYLSGLVLGLHTAQPWTVEPDTISRTSRHLVIHPHSSTPYSFTQSKVPADTNVTITPKERISGPPVIKSHQTKGQAVVI